MNKSNIKECVFILCHCSDLAPVRRAIGQPEVFTGRVIGWSDQTAEPPLTNTSHWVSDRLHA